MRALLLLALAAGSAAAQGVPPHAVALDTLTWAEAERVLTPEAVVVLPLGAAAKEHGLHLPLNADFLQATYFAGQIAEAVTAPTVFAPPLAYGYYPAFVTYPGSTTLQLVTARDAVVDLVRTWARQGPRRFYVVNIGISTLRPLAEAARLLALDGILLGYTNLLVLEETFPEGLVEQEDGSHADEVETSIMLHIAPDVVDMALARRDLTLPYRLGGLTRDPEGPGTYSPTGAWGDPTLATPEKGAVIVARMLAGILRDIEGVRSGPLPEPFRLR